MSKKCPKCDAENRDQAKHCSACGSPLTPSDSGVRYCPSGRHPMDPGWDVCPYCASEDAASRDPASTVPESVPDLPPPPGAQAARKKTMIDPLAEKWRQPQEGTGDAAAQSVSGRRKKTAFAPVEGRPGPLPEPGMRRIVAVLVTYTWKPEGQLFPVREGRNYLGSDPECEISLDLDDQMSAQHATIIYRGKDFWIDDEKSMNGTYVNGESVEEKQRLADAAQIQTGATVWKFVSLEPAP